MSTGTNVHNAYLRHDEVLTLAHVRVLRAHQRLQEAQVLDVLAVRLDAVHSVLHDLLADLVAEGHVVAEDGRDGLRLQQLQREHTIHTRTILYAYKYKYARKSTIRTNTCVVLC